jgi:hypothetical protein
MSLDFNVTKVADYEKVTTDPFDSTKWHPVTSGIVWLTMAIDMNGPTKENLDEFTRRAMIWQSIAGASLYDRDMGDLYLTRKDFELHIGLYTNVTTRSKAEFNKKVLALLNDQFEGKRLASLKQNVSAYERINTIRDKEKQTLGDILPNDL